MSLFIEGQYITDNYFKNKLINPLSSPEKYVDYLSELESSDVKISPEVQLFLNKFKINHRKISYKDLINNFIKNIEKDDINILTFLELLTKDQLLLLLYLFYEKRIFISEIKSFITSVHYQNRNQQMLSFLKKYNKSEFDLLEPLKEVLRGLETSDYTFSKAPEKIKFDFPKKINFTSLHSNIQIEKNFNLKLNSLTNVNYNSNLYKEEFLSGTLSYKEILENETLTNQFYTGEYLNSIMYDLTQSINSPNLEKKSFDLQKPLRHVVCLQAIGEDTTDLLEDYYSNNGDVKTLVEYLKINDFESDNVLLECIFSQDDDYLINVKELINNETFKKYFLYDIKVDSNKKLSSLGSVRLIEKIENIYQNEILKKLNFSVTLETILSNFDDLKQILSNGISAEYDDIIDKVSKNILNKYFRYLISFGNFKKIEDVLILEDLNIDTFLETGEKFRNFIFGLQTHADNFLTSNFMRKLKTDPFNNREFFIVLRKEINTSQKSTLNKKILDLYCEKGIINRNADKFFIFNYNKDTGEISYADIRIIKAEEKDASNE